MGPINELTRLQGSKRRQTKEKGALDDANFSSQPKRGKQSHAKGMPSEIQGIVAPSGKVKFKQAKEGPAQDEGRTSIHVEHQSVEQPFSEKEAATAGEPQVEHEVQELRQQLVIQRERYDVKVENMSKEITMLKEALKPFTRIHT